MGASLTVVRLDELDKTEWFDVWRRLSPAVTWDEFEDDWADFQAMKADHERRKALS